MARIHILRDIVDLGLDPKVAHTGVKSKGRLKATVNDAQEATQEVVQEATQEVLKEKATQEAQAPEQKKQQKQKGFSRFKYSRMRVLVMGRARSCGLSTC